jgi:endonuclease YncB( thermonuclease family)
MNEVNQFLAKIQAEGAQAADANAEGVNEFMSRQQNNDPYSEESILGRVYDGDSTYDSEGGHRMLGGNTSELRTDNGSAQPLSVEAQERARELLNTGRYKKSNSGEKGYYGRHLTNYVDENGDAMINQLIREGYAAPTSYDGSSTVERAQGAAINANYEAAETFERTGTTPALDSMRDYQVGSATLTSTRDDRRGIVKKSWTRGKDLMQMNLHQFGELIGEVTGVDTIKEWGEEGVIRNMYQASLSPAEIESTDDIDSLADLGRYIVEKGVENAPNFLTDLAVAAGAAGATALTGGVAAPILYAAIGKQFVGKLGWRAAGKFGMGASMYAQMTGESRATQLAAGVDNPALAFGAGAINTALEYRGLQSILKGFMPKGKITNAAGLAKHISKQAGISTGIEGSTEWLQGLTNQLAIKMEKPDHEIDWHELSESFFAGMAAGGFTSTVLSTAGGGTNYLLEKSRLQNLDTDTIPETPDAVQAQVNEVGGTESQRDTAVFPQKESLKDINVPEGTIVSEHKDGSTIVTTNPEKAALHKDQGMAAAKELRGYPQSKQEILESGEPVFVVTRTDAEGNELSSALAAESQVAATRAHAEAEAKPTDKIVIAKAEQSKVLDERQSAIDSQVKTQTEAQESLETEQTLEAPTIEKPIKEAKVIDRVDMSPVAESEEGTASIENEAGVLRSAASLIKDLTTGKLSVATVIDRLESLGVDPDTDLTIETTAVDREATINNLLSAGIKSELLMLSPDDPKAKRNPYKNARDILLDDSISDQDLVELAKQEGITPTIQNDFNEKAMITKIITRLTSKKRQLPDDVSGAAFLFTNTADELVRRKDSSDYKKDQKRGVFISGLDVVPSPRLVLEARLNAIGVENDRKLELLRIATALGVKVAVGERKTKNATTIKTKRKASAVKLIQKLFDATTGPREDDRSVEESKEDVATKAEAAKKIALDRKNERDADKLEKMPQIKAEEKKKQAANRKKATGQPVEVTEDLVKRIEQGIKNLPVDQVEDETTDESVDDLYITPELRAILEEARAKAFDLAIVKRVFELAGLPLPFSYMKLGNWTPKSEDLDTKAARSRIVRFSKSQSAKDFANRELGIQDDLKGVIKRIKAAKTDAARLIILKKGIIERDIGTEYANAELDGERYPELYTVADYLTAGASGFSNTSTQTEDPETSSQQTFEYNLGGTEVHKNTRPKSTETLARELVLGKDVDTGVGGRYVFGRIAIGRNNKTYYDDNKSESTYGNTYKANGKNLITAFKNSNNFAGPVMLDAVRLVQMGLGYMPGAESSQIHIAGDALRGFYRAIDRMMMGEVLGTTYQIDVRSINDGVVLYFDKDGKGVTLGEAKSKERKLNPDNPSWIRGLNREDIQGEVDPWYEELDKIRASIVKKLDKEPNNTDFKHALNWLDGQINRYDSMEGDTNSTKTAAIETDNQRRVRVGAENKAIRKVAPNAIVINDAIVDVWNRARTEQYDDRLGMDQDEPGFQDDPANVDTIDNDRGRVGDQEIDQDEKDQQFDPKTENPDPDGQKVAEFYGEGVTTNERNLANSRGANQNDTAGAPSVAIGVDRATGVEVTRGESKSTTEVDTTWKPQTKSTFLGKGLSKFTNEIQQLLDYVQSSKIGLKLPLVVIAESDLNAKSLPELDAKTINKLRRNMAKGHNGAFLSMGSYGIIVLKAPIAGSANKNRANALAIMSHEIGHAVFESMSVDYQGILEKAYKEQGNQGDGKQMREWVADQVAHYIAARGKTAMKGNANEFTKAIAKIADALVGLWRTATRALMENGVYIDFSYYFDSVISERDAAFRLNVPNTNLYNLTNKEAAHKLRSTGARAKQTIKGGWRPITAVLRSVYSRLSDYSKELSAELYQKSQTSGPQAYEQLQRFLHDDMQSKFAKVEQRIGAAKMKQAFKDLRAGNLTADARAVRTAITQVNKILKSYVPTMYFRDDFIAEAFDHAAIEKNRAAFEQLLVDAKIASSADVHTVVQDMLYSDGITDYALAPGKAVSTHQTVNAILGAVSSEELMAGGFLLDNPHAIMSHYIATSAKRAAWEFKFGGYTADYKGDTDTIRYRLLTQAGYDVTSMSGREAKELAAKTGLEKGGKFYSPNHRINQYLEQIRSDYGESGVKATKELLDSALGRLGNDIPPQLRNSFDWITTWMNLTLLAFSGVASLPELAGSVIRARGQLSAADFVDVIKDLKQSRQFATDLGIILTDGAEQMALETMGAQYSSPMQHKISQVFFKVNGQQFITRLSRTMALSTGKRFIINAAERVANGDTAAADELSMIHIDAKTVNQWVKDGMPSDNMTVNKALNQFVYESSIKPSKFEATKWGNNPYWKLAWHLKQFFYSYGTIIVGGIARHSYQKYQQAVKNGTAPTAAALMASTPLLIAGLAFLPLAALSEELRELIKGKERTGNMSDEDYAKLLISKTGGLGPFEMVSSMYQAYSWNNSPIASLTPFTGFIETMVDGDVSAEKKLQRVVPFYSQNVLSGLYK